MTSDSNCIFARVSCLMLVLGLIIRMFSTKRWVWIIIFFSHFHFSVWLVIWRILFSAFQWRWHSKQNIYMRAHFNEYWMEYIFCSLLCTGSLPAPYEFVRMFTDLSLKKQTQISNQNTNEMKWKEYFVCVWEAFTFSAHSKENNAYRFVQFYCRSQSWPSFGYSVCGVCSCSLPFLIKV